MHDPHSHLLSELRALVRDEQEAGLQQLRGIWHRPLAEKRDKGWTQGFVRIERGADSTALWAYLDDGESRFRVGDLLVLHSGNPQESALDRGLSLESEEDDRWLLRSHGALTVFENYRGGPCYADPDAIDLTPYYEQSLDAISTSQIGREVVLPLLAGTLAVTFNEGESSDAERIALDEGFNPAQAQAVGFGYGANQVACIQGPPGTGKTLVLSLIARLMVQRGERVLLTSHTHTAINNALNKIHAQQVPVVKIGRDTQRRGLDEPVACCPSFSAWEARPAGGYVIGATPFATCTTRLANCEFDSIIFDEASQITVPLALMAMRKGKRFIFVGDQKQLPPVMLSRSVLSKDSFSVFATLTSQDADHAVMLNETYRMNRWLTDWPSRQYYEGLLIATGANRERTLSLNSVPQRLEAVFDPAASGVFIPTLDRASRTRNFRDAELVVELCAAAVDGGLTLDRIGIVTPYRAQGRIVRDLLAQRFGRAAAQQVVADTVERMQGQERELIVLSLATGDEVFLGAVAPFFFQPERLNVSITRAISKLIVIGPALAAAPETEELTIKLWVRQYIDLIHHLKRVDL